MAATANQNGVVGGGHDQHYRFTVLADGILRMEWAPDYVFEDRLSSFAANRNKAKIPKFEVRETDQSLEIITARFHLTYNKQEFSAYGLYAFVFPFTRSLWRFKEEGQPNLGGTYRTLDNVDGNIDRETGKPIEIEPGVLSTKGYALLDDSKSLLFTQDGFVASRRAGSDRIDCYLFAYGHDYREGVKALYSISGSTPLLPRWSLGNWWSRYYDYTADTYRELMDTFEAEKIPLSVAVIDMGWHWVHEKRVIEAGQTGWTGYSWNTNFFPDPPTFLKDLHKRNLKVTLNDHPADGVASYEDKYEEVAKAVKFDTSKTEPVPFDCVDKEYLNAYFDIVLKALEHDGVDFWWIDWQQGQWSRMRGVDPLWVLNHFHFAHNKAVTKDKHPMIFSRYGGPGSHRYPVGFSGDTYTTWDSLRFQPGFTAMASNIGYGWWSHDIGGHMGGIKDDELTARWVQFGVLSPIMRLHSTQNRWVTKEPWRLPHEPRAVITNFLRFRHRLIPYLQTMNYRASVHGEPLIEPMYWSHPESEEAYKVRNQYRFGTEMMVVPIVDPQEPRLKLAKVRAWLPPGKHIDYFTGVVYEGGRTVWLSRPLDRYPIFFRPGSIVPLDGALKPANGGDEPTSFEIVIAIGADGAFDLLEEPVDGQNEWRRTRIEYNQAKGSLTVKESFTSSKFRKWCVRFLGVSTPKSLSSSTHFEQSDESDGLFMRLGEESSFEIYLGSDPKFRKTRALDMIEPVLQGAQIEYETKDRVWAALEDESLPVSTRMNRIQGLEMSEELKLVLMECLSVEN